jgi:molybdenum cofactor cytidylyltransferase
LIAAVVLAAGGSRRLGGQPKQLLRVDGRLLVARVLDAVVGSRVGETIAVTGYRADEVRAAAGEVAVRWVDNPDWPGGMSTSLKAGLVAVGPEAAGVLLVLADQPFLSSTLIDRLIAAFETAPGPVIVRPACGGKAGHPVLVARPFIKALQTAEGDEGGRGALAAFSRQIITVSAAEWEIMDVDTREDAARCGARWS